MPGGGTYGKNIKKKLNSSPDKKIPKIKLPAEGSSNCPILIQGTVNTGKRVDEIIK